ncbi:BAG family molecular chaperone regulator 2 [Quillaja saponaria]|uniref:BAG family molecular chaperone regulator 2 n=1 Tax=Quillaja saponaria TaxID=32244 RepID=A0AAD7VGJ4_QUISA|nr:BAG family molecular chaperone regulator 2 [Quillaja saponaria]
MMIKLRSKRFSKSSSSKVQGSQKLAAAGDHKKDCRNMMRGDDRIGEIKWELRPGGMLVQKREFATQSVGEEMITVRVSTVSKWHDISIQSTSTFGELKTILSIVTSLEPREQRVLFKGKEREDGEYLHMVGVQDKDKVLLLQDPGIKETKMLHSLGIPQHIITSYS